MGRRRKPEPPETLPADIETLCARGLVKWHRHRGYVLTIKGRIAQKKREVWGRKAFLERELSE